MHEYLQLKGVNASRRDRAGHSMEVPEDVSMKNSDAGLRETSKGVLKTTEL
jgi:hypothetical protein